MRRREFLSAMGGTMMLPGLVAAQHPSRSTVLYDGRAILLERTTVDGNALWIQQADLPSINGFALKPQGACRDEICIPIPRPMMNGTRFNLSAFAQRAGQRAVADPAQRVWSFGEIPVVRGAFLESRQSPDFAVPDRKGRLVRLSQFRGKKVLVVTWASW